MLLVTQRNKPWIAAAGVFLLMLSAEAFSTFKAYQDKIVAQDHNNKELQGFKSKLSRLLPVKDEWNSTFPVMSSRDVLTVYRSLNVDESGLRARPDTLSAKEIPVVAPGNVNIGLIGVCLTNNDGFYVEASSVGALVDGLEKMMKAPHIDAKQIHITTSAYAVQATIANLCVRLREA